MKDKLVRLCYEGTSVLVMASVIIAIIFTFFVRFIGVVGTSMTDTLDSGNWVIISEMGFNYEPSYGDIVVISQPGSMEENIIKRVIATEGQQVNINFNTGAVYIDGHEIIEPYISTPTTNHYDVNFPVTVPAGHCFVMGDNRQGSVDSRSTIIGFIDNRSIIGNALVGITSDGFANLDVSESS